MICNAAELAPQHVDTVAEGGECTWHFVHNQIPKSDMTVGEMNTSFSNGSQSPNNPVVSYKQNKKVRHYEVVTMSVGEITLQAAQDDIAEGKIVLSDVSCVLKEEACPCDFSKAYVEETLLPSFNWECSPGPFAMPANPEWMLWPEYTANVSCGETFGEGTEHLVAYETHSVACIYSGGGHMHNFVSLLDESLGICKSIGNFHDIERIIQYHENLTPGQIKSCLTDINNLCP